MPNLKGGQSPQYPLHCFLPKPSHGGFGQFFPNGTYTRIGTSVNHEKKNSITIGVLGVWYNSYWSCRFYETFNLQHIFDLMLCESTQ